MASSKSSNGFSRITSREVALQAGVSQSTVSRVFSGDERLSDATRERVFEVARELGYKPNAIARSLITKRTQIIGLVSNNIENPYFPPVLQALTQRLHEMGWKVLLITAGTSEDVDALLPEVLAYQVDGLIIVTAAVSNRMTQEALQRGIPVLLVSRYAPGSGVSAVCCANYEGGREIADAFLNAGHKRLAYIGGLEDTPTNVDRQRGFLDRLHERNVHDCVMKTPVFNYQGGYQAGMELLQSDTPPDAIFCANDLPAFGVLDVARKLGIKVPEQLSVIGFDDIPMAQWAGYDLTTVRQPIEQMVETSIDLLLERIQNPKMDAVNMFLPGTLIKRGSARI